MKRARPLGWCSVVLVGCTWTLWGCSRGDQRENPPTTAGVSGNVDGGTSSTGADAGAGSARLKFCNGLSRNGTPVELVLEVAGFGSLAVRSGECAPPIGSDCASVPAEETTLRLREGPRLLAELSRAFGDMEQVLVIADLNPLGRPGIVVRPLAGAARCAEIDPFPRRQVDAAAPPAADASTEAGGGCMLSACSYSRGSGLSFAYNCGTPASDSTTHYEYDQYGNVTGVTHQTTFTNGRVVMCTVNASTLRGSCTDNTGAMCSI